MAWPNGQPPLVLSSYTLGTDVGFGDRVRIAAAAGFDGIGLRAENYWDAQRDGLDDAAMIEILDLHGIAVREVEYLTGWGSDGERDAAQRAKEQTVLRMARAFGVGHLNAGVLERHPVEVLTAGFAALCARADPFTVALEFMPYSGVPDLATAWAVVRDAGMPNGALLVDAWHWSRSGMTAADLEPIPADRIVAVQLCDVGERPMEPLRAESLGHRLLPGQGYGDVLGMIRALQSSGVAPRVVGVEVISDELVSRGLETAAQASLAAARDVLAKAG